MNFKFVICLAVVFSGGLLGCSTFNARPNATSNVTAVGTYISEIHMIDARNGWAWSSGDEYSNLLQTTLLLHTSNGGRTWQDRTPRAFAYISDGCCFLDSQTAWVSTLDRKTDIGGLLRTTDGGKSWAVLIKQGTASYGCFCNDLSQCHFSNANEGVANTADGSAGMSWRRFFETHDGGKDWNLLNIIPPGGPYSNDLSGMIGVSDITPESLGFCPPANVVIAHGDLDDEQPKDGVRISLSTNLGKAWREVRLPLPSEKYRDGLVECDTPIFLDGKNGWLPVHIVKYGVHYTFEWNVLAFYLTHDGGKTWAARAGVIEGTTNLVGSYGQVDIVSTNDIYVWNGGNLYVSHDGAKSWRVIRPKPGLGRNSPEDIVQTDFVDSRRAWVIIHETFSHFPHDKIPLYRTSNGGKTWTELPLKISN